MATTQITMKDGSTRDFGEKAKVLKESRIEGDKVIVQFAFRNGEIKTYTMGKDHELFMRAAQHGLDQKLGDAFSGVDDVDDCILAFEKVTDQLEKNDWNKGRASDGMAGTSTLAKALVKVTGQTIEQVKETLKTLEPAQKTALRKQPAVQAAILEIESEKAKKGPQVNADDILAKFNGATAAAPAGETVEGVPTSGKKSKKTEAA